MEGKQIPEVRKHNHNVLRMRCLPIVCTVKVRMKLVFGLKLKVTHTYNDQGITWCLDEI